MTKTEFLTAVLADTGVYCSVGIINGKIRSRFFDDIPSLVAESDFNVSAGADSYYAMSSFEASHTMRRLASAVSHIKSFWLDLDCGPTKSYATQADAVAAVTQFCADLGIPQPLCVNSGNGVHTYWVLPEAIKKDLWTPVARRLKEVCVERNLHADPSCTTDAARILRVVGTTNFKDKLNPKPVDHIGGLGLIDLIEFATALGAPAVPRPTNELGFEVPDYIKTTEMDETSKTLMGKNNTYRFSKIISLQIAGCAQLNHIMVEQKTIEEPLWRAGLSIAQHCVDRDTAIHGLSNQHPSYSADETETKADLTKGPYTCTMFDSLRSKVCSDCAHKGKFGSPIVLGKEIAEATEADNIIETVDAQTHDKRVYQIPTYPFPFFRGKFGGIYRRAESGQEDAQDKLIYENDLYVVKRMHDPAFGEVLWMRLHLPMDGVREFSIPLVSALSKDRFRDAIGAHGVVALDKALNELMFYVSRWVKDLQKMEQAEKVRTQFGWTEEGTFILGDREITPNGVKYSPPSTAIMNVCGLLTKKGELAEWKSVVDIYAARGMEAQAFAFLLGFGTPLVKFTQIRGGIVNLVSSQSGTGKSTVQMAINSIWGQPFDLLLQNDDTYNAKIFRFGVMNNLPVTIDEITNMREDIVSQLSYAVTQGRGKNRMESQTNAERINNTMWRLLAITSSNASLYDKLFSLKEFPEGELMRIIELKISRDPNLAKEFTDALFAKLGKHHGIAGEVFMQYVVGNLPEVLEILRDVQLKLDAAAGLGQRERFWSSIGALGITAGIICERMGLIGFDMKRIFRWLVALLRTNKGEIASTPADGTSAIGSFINANIRSILVTKDSPDPNGLPTPPLVTPMSELLIRYESDTKCLYLTQKRFKEWCTKNQISYHETISSLRNMGVRVESVKKRMAKGLMVAAPPVNAILIDDTISRVFDVEAIVAKSNETGAQEAGG
jgi:hypothetical protein